MSTHYDSMTQDGLLIGVSIGGEGRVHFFSPVQTGLPRELAKLLTHATQPGLVSPDGGEQAQRHYPASLYQSPGKVFAM